MPKLIRTHLWFFIALAAVLLAAPHAMIIRIVVSEADPLYWVLSRFVLASLVLVPFAIWKTNFKMFKKAWKPLVIASFASAGAVILYTQAIYHSQASYVSILTLLTPIILILISARFFKEHITRRKAAGVTLAMIGALILVTLPLILTQQTGYGFYPLATFLALIQSFLFVTAIIAMRSANEAGLPLVTVVGSAALAGVLLTAPLFAMFGNYANTPVDLGYLLAVLYSGVGIAAVFRAITIAAYEHIGAVATAALQYVEILVAVLLPVLFINEKLSLSMVAGGIMILFGVYLIESHHKKHIHHALHRHH